MKSSLLLTTLMLAVVFLQRISSSPCEFDNVTEIYVEVRIVLEDIVVINWTPQQLDTEKLKNYVLEYKQTNEETFKTIIFPNSVVSTGSPKLQRGIEYEFQVYGVFTVNGMECESERSPLVNVTITNDSSSQCTDLVTSVSVLSVILLFIIIICTVIAVLVIKKIVIKKCKVQQRNVEPTIETLYENVQIENSMFREDFQNAIYECRDGLHTEAIESTLYEPVRTDIALSI